MLSQNYRQITSGHRYHHKVAVDRDWGSMSEGRILFKVSPPPCPLRWAGRLPIIPDIPDIGLHEGTEGSELRIRKRWDAKDVFWFQTCKWIHAQCSRSLGGGGNISSHNQKWMTDRSCHILGEVLGRNSWNFNLIENALLKNQHHVNLVIRHSLFRNELLRSNSDFCNVLRNYIFFFKRNLFGH